MPEFVTIEATKRTITGKQVKRLRSEGIVPAIVYGPDTDPLPLSIDGRELRLALLQAGGTQIIEINVDGEAIPTLAREVQRNPIRGDIMHVDFYQVSMNRAIRAEVPVMIEGEIDLVTAGAAVLVQGTTTLTVEALPAALPPHISVDASRLVEIGDQLLVQDLEVPDTYQIIADDTELIAKLDYPRMIEEEEEEEEELFLEEADVEVIREARGEEEEEEE